jgi:hypothetical protein
MNTLSHRAPAEPQPPAAERPSGAPVAWLHPALLRAHAGAELLRCQGETNMRVRDNRALIMSDEDVGLIAAEAERELVRPRQAQRERGASCPA